MNKFEKYCWNKGIKNSLFGAGFIVNQEFHKLIKLFLNIKFKKCARVQQFMGVKRYE